MNTLTLDGYSLNLNRAQAIASGAKLKISGPARTQVEACRKLIEKLIDKDEPVYSLNTGLGYFAQKKIKRADLKKLQLNTLRSHAGGFGEPLSTQETRLAMALRLNVLLKGRSGVTFELCQALVNLINAEIYPIVPSYGSVGASGDLIPLAHLCLPLLGEGEVIYKGRRMQAKKALTAARLKTYTLAEREGLSLINGTQAMLSVGVLALIEAQRLQEICDKVTALSYEALRARLEPLDKDLHTARGQQGQKLAANTILNELKGSYLNSGSLERKRLQDSYSLRCAAQVHGASRDALEYARGIVEIELNAATDNPLIFTESKKVLSGGNFHGQCLALAFDFSAIAVAELANISERRIELLMNPHMSGLPAFLAGEQGLDSGYMVLQYLAASLVNENKILSHPASTDSIPGNVGIEDHVSMGMTAARKFRKIVENAKAVLAAEYLAAAQAIDLQSAIKLGQGTAKSYAHLRKVLKPLKQDRIVASDLKLARGALEGLC